MRTCVRIADHRSPNTVFDAAIKSGDLFRIDSAAAILPRITLYHRAHMLLVIVDQDHDRYPTAAKRLVSELCLERQRPIPLPDIAKAAAALEVLPITPGSARQVLAEVFSRVQQPHVADVFAPRLPSK